MKKIFSLLAAVLMAGSMMAEDGWIKFSEPQPATEVAGSTYGSEGFTLEIPATSDKASVDANSCTFGLSAEETVSFTHRLKTGGASSKDGRIFTLNIPEEGPLAIYARTSTSSSTDRYFVIANGSDTIVKHICLDADVVEGTSIFKPVIVENVPAGSYEITYNNGINFYGFELVGDDAPAAMDTVYFVNAADWAAVKFYAWDGNGESMTWPGLDVEKADYQLQGKDVYFFVAEAGAYGKCIFNNNNNAAQTADLDWTPGKYYYNGSWMTREELEAPVVVDMYLKHNWAGAGSWTWKQLTYDAENETYTLRDIYGGTGCNWNTSASDNGSNWVATPTLVGEPAVGDSAVFTLAEGAITITKIMGEVGPEPVITKDTAYYFAGETTEWAFAAMPYTVALPKDSTIEFKQVMIVTTTSTLAEEAPVVAHDTIWCGQMTEGYVMTRESMTEAGWVLDGTYNVVLTADAEGDYVFAMNGAALTVTFPEKQQETTINYYLAGSMNTPAWGSVAMPGDSIVLNLAAGEHGFKVQTGEGVWDNALSYDNVNADCSSEGIYTNGDRNVMFTLEEAGEVKIKVVEGQICVTGAFLVPETYNYYLAGKMNNWGSTGMAGDSIVLSLEAGEHEFKIQLVAGYWDNALGYSAVDTGCSSTGITEGENGNVAFTLAQAGEVKIKVVEGQICVTLPAAGPTTIINNAEAVKAVKMIENGQLVIIREGKRYNALGAQF